MTDAFRFFLECVNLFFIIYLIGYSSFLFLSVVAGAIELYRSYRLEQMHNKLWQSYYIPVSILVPAYNEEVTVKDTVTSLLNLDYKESAHYFDPQEEWRKSRQFKCRNQCS